MFITDLNLQDWEIKRIITDYRKLLKLSEAIADYESAPFSDLIWHIESLLPAFANEHKSGEIGEGYRALQQKVMSDISIDELMEISSMPLIAGGMRYDRKSEGSTFKMAS